MKSRVLIALVVSLLVFGVKGRGVSGGGDILDCNACTIVAGEIEGYLDAGDSQGLDQFVDTVTDFFGS